MNMKTPGAERIANLNDALRKRGVGGRIMLTQGIQALGQNAVNEIMALIRDFNTFTVDNNPYGERDYGSIKYNGEKVLWKIDYYDNKLEYASPDPSNSKMTCRVMTIMLGSEY